MMQMRGVNGLIEMRKRRYRPAGFAFITIGHDCLADWADHPETEDVVSLSIDPGANPEHIDLRPVIGLDVILVAGKYTGQAMRLFERLQELAKSVQFVAPEFEEDLGFVWDKTNGMRPL